MKKFLNEFSNHWLLIPFVLFLTLDLVGWALLIMFIYYWRVFDSNV